MKREIYFATEAALCAAFIAALPAEWCAFNETAGWDILLLRRRDGCQVGIQAKLKLNGAVLRQAADGGGIYHYGTRPGPDYRAVLVPANETNELSALAPFCAITVVLMPKPSRYHTLIYPVLPGVRGADDDDWHDMLPSARHPVPEYVPDVAAGVPGPVQLTTWKISALKLAVLLDATGVLVRDDFKRVRVDPRRWISQRWIVPGDGAFVLGPRFPDLRGQHPRVWEEIAADPRKWARPVPLMAWPKHQPAMTGSAPP